MGTDITPEISRRNKYYISRHRYYELKHYCLQYPEWKRAYRILNEKLESCSKSIANPTDAGVPHNTETMALAMAAFAQNMKLVEDTAKRTDSLAGPYIFKAVTEGYSYPYFSTVLKIPMSRDKYYEMYRRFFWLLDDVRT